MSYEMLEKELKDLPEASLDEVIEYIKFLKYKLLNADNSLSDLSSATEKKHPKRKLGVLQGTFIMSDDFDETPDCFKEYM